MNKEDQEEINQTHADLQQDLQEAHINLQDAEVDYSNALAELREFEAKYGK